MLYCRECTISYTTKIKTSLHTIAKYSTRVTSQIRARESNLLYLARSVLKRTRLKGKVSLRTIATHFTRLTCQMQARGSKLALPCKECTKAYTTKRESKFAHYCDAFHASRITSRRLNRLHHTTLGLTTCRRKFYLLMLLHRALRQDLGLWVRRCNRF